MKAFVEAKKKRLSRKVSVSIINKSPDIAVAGIGLSRVICCTLNMMQDAGVIILNPQPELETNLEKN